MIKKVPLFVPINWKGQRLRVMRVIKDKDFGEIWDSYLDHRHVYILNDKKLQVVEEQSLIDELDNRYGIPVNERAIDYEYYDDED